MGSGPVWPLNEEDKSYAIEELKEDIVSVPNPSEKSTSFSAAYRLHHPTQFQTVWKTGQRISLSSIGLVSCKNQVGHARLGISVAKKNIRLATRRNRLKRIARETFRLRFPNLPSRDFVVVIYKGAIHIPLESQFLQFTQLWDRFLTHYTKA